MRYPDFKTVLCNFLYQFEKTIDTLRETILKITAIFFVWFTTVFAIGFALLIIIKISFILLPELKQLGFPAWA